MGCLTVHLTSCQTLSRTLDNLDMVSTIHFIIRAAEEKVSPPYFSQFSFRLCRSQTKFMVLWTHAARVTGIDEQHFCTPTSELWWCSAERQQGMTDYTFNPFRIQPADFVPSMLHCLRLLPRWWVATDGFVVGERTQPIGLRGQDTRNMIGQGYVGAVSQPGLLNL